MVCGCDEKLALPCLPPLVQRHCSVTLDSFTYVILHFLCSSCILKPALTTCHVAIDTQERNRCLELPWERVTQELLSLPVRLLSSTSRPILVPTCCRFITFHLGASGQNAATQHGAFSTATPTAGSSGLFGGSTSSSRSIFGSAPAVGNSGISPFGSTTPSTGRGFGNGSSPFGSPAAAPTSNAIRVGVY